EQVPAMQLLLPAILCLLGSCLGGTGARQYESILMVPNGGPWGSWGHKVTSPFFFASSKVQPFQGFWLFGDDTALNGVRLLCTDGQRLDKWGNWTKAQLCSSNRLVSFSLRVERWQYLWDNTAVNNFRFACSNGTLSNCTSGAICGLQTKVEKPQGKWDDTALNDMRVCCK
uniref:VMO1 protein n=1 Tax=Zosterops lateralis melanops TaxID=1220523 RepID=A0A8D2PEC0_ZOSLA